MNTNFRNLVEFQQYFKDEETCRKHLEIQRWGDIIICPYCQSDRVYRFSDGKRFKCAEKTCNKKFTVTVGTIYENSKIPLQKWFLALYILGNHKKGISSCQLARDLGVTQKTAWFINHRIRVMVSEKSPKTLGNMVEIDETYVGGKLANKHKKERRELLKLGTGMVHRTPVFGIVERKGHMVLYVTLETDGKTLKPIIRKVVDKDAIIVTDGFGAYQGLGSEFKAHEIVNHAQDEYVRGEFHTNTIEGFFSLLKRGIIGIYHSVSPKHLHRYCEEFAARYNTRKIKDYDRFDVFVKNSEGRLKYKDLIRK